MYEGSQKEEERKRKRRGGPKEEREEEGAVEGRGEPSVEGPKEEASVKERII